MTRLAFDPTVYGEEAMGRLDFLLLVHTPIHQFSDRRLMQECSDRLSGLGYRSVAVDASGWLSEADAAEGLAGAFSFDTEGGIYLPEELTDLAFWKYGGQGGTGTVVCLFGYNAFREAEPEEAQFLLDSFATAARQGLVVDHPMLVLVEAPDTVFWEKVGGQVVSHTTVLPSYEP